MKKEYNQPIIEVVKLDCEDVITTSTFDDDSILDGNADTWFS